jgi:hypothetical protein
MVLLKVMPQFYAGNVTGVLQRGEFPMNQVWDGPPVGAARVGETTGTIVKATARGRGRPHRLGRGIQAGDFSGE